MKKLFSLIVILVAFSSCTTDVKFNNPGFQAYRDDFLFRGIDVRAYKTSTGAITITALAQDEQVDLNLPTSSLGTYYLGTTNQSIKATYSSSFDDVNLLYDTRIIPGSVSKMQNGMVSGGSGYVSDCDLVGTQYACSGSHQTTGGSGSGLTLSVMADASGVVTGVKVASPGNNYKAGDLITISGGDNNATCRVVNVDRSNGEIVITDNSGGTISGTFKFNGSKANINPLAADLVNFQHGEFYKVPVIPAP